jgi:predicted short-subunit dehydrogenase-like oxidoreductase (DUF2520 family)
MRIGGAWVAESVTIVGAGALGTSLGLLLARAGWTLQGICSRTHRRALAASLRLGCPAFPDPAEPLARSSVLLLAISDDQVEAVFRRLAPALRPGTLAAHTSGVHGPEVLAGAELPLALHPLQSVPDPEAGLARLPGSVFSLQGPPQALERGRAVVEALGGLPLPLPEGADRALYHAAACVLSNFTVVLAAWAEELGRRAGMAEPLAALRPLLRGTVANLETLPPARALTGPARRGDAATVRRHLQALARAHPETLDLYRQLTRATLRLAGQGQTAPGVEGPDPGAPSPDPLEAVWRVLEEDCPQERP